MAMRARKPPSRSPPGSAEDRLIARHFRPLATHPGALGLADDAAVITVPPGRELVLKTDGVIEGVHFFADDPPDTVAKKALRINLSDLAAKGAEPLGFLLSVALTRKVADAWLKTFVAGLRADARKYKCALLGGDTDRTPGLVSVTIAAFGTVPRGAMVRRDGARPGDCIVVTGTIGDAALGVILRRDPGAAKRWGLDRKMRAHLLQRYLVPEPRNALAPALRACARGGLDISDGLVGDLAKLCRASGVGATIEAARVPLSRAARTALAAEPTLIETILTGGDDFEVLASVPAGKLELLRQAGRRAGVTVSAIGRVTRGRGEPRVIDAQGRVLEFARPSYSHF
ncbi:MAG TPA: thiamine-phosphate kinase [Xanthobacteraceae bacterium]|nr:thiamine-phosphate kinase [Xanthobacteraceae bacterium]